MSTLIAFPTSGNGGGRTHTDSHVTSQNTSNDSWVNVRAESGSSLEASRGNMGVIIRTESTNTKWRHFSRAVLSFDTSPITAGGVISAATLAMTSGNGNKIDDFTDSISLVGATPGDAGELVAGDFAQLQTTKFATDITVAAMADDGTTPNTYTLNDDGEAAINKTGVTSFGLRTTHDRGNNEPSHPSAIKNTTVWFFTADEAEAGDERPVLTVTYTITFTPRLAMMF
jgi:hypothetical protein